MATSDLELKGTSVIVTGGGRGLGRAMTHALAAAGASILVVDIDKEPLEEVCDGEATVPFVGDVTLTDDIDAAIAACLSSFGRLDMVVNNAGIGMSALRTGTEKIPFYEVTRESFQKFLDVHVLAPFLLSKAAVPHLVGQGFGRILTITTSLWHMLPGDNTPYGPAKAASEALTSAMAADLEGTGVTANVLVPGGGADTRFVPDVPGRSRAHLINPVVMGPPAVFFASRASDGITAHRVIAKDWDTSLPAMEAFERSSTPIGWPGSH